MSNLGQGYWERRRVGGTHTRDTGEKERNLSLLTYCEFKPGFCSQRCSQIIWLRKNLNGVNWWPDWFLAYCFPCDIGALFPTVPSMTPNSNQSCGQTKYDLWISECADWWTVWRMVPIMLPNILSRPNISPDSAPLPNFQASAERTKN